MSAVSERDVIAETIAAHALYYDEFGPHRHVCACGWHVPDELEEEYLDGAEAKFTLAHAAHVAAALREARTVWTVEELDALPVGTVAMAERRVYVLGGGATVEPSRVARRYSKWRANGVVKDLDDLPLPALVLWTPDEDGAQ